MTPISPLYTISGAEGMAPAPVTLKIPATIPDGSFAMGFFYDAASGRLEGMPLLAEDGTSVTVATEHFSSIFVSLVERALLPDAIDSGFRPGVDDWQFTNRGSYITPTGNCAGQTLTEAWYYVERRLKGRGLPLYGLYDNNGYGATPTPSLWQDDSNGYRLASVAQNQYLANDTAIDDFLRGRLGRGLDALEYDAFRYAISVTGEPQLVVMTDAQGNHGHAILAYRVDPAGIFVADPNYPGPKAMAKRVVPFDTATGKFGAYASGESADAIANGSGVTYTNFVYDAKTAMVDWSALAADWAAFDAGTIGVGLFPVYVLERYAGMDAQGAGIWVPFVDGYQTSDKHIALRLRDPKGGDSLQMEVFGGLSSTNYFPDWVGIDLKDGENRLGIYEQGRKTGWTGGKYVDFLRFTVIVGPAAPPAPSPTPQAGGRWVLTGAVEDAPQSWENEIDKISIIDSANGRFTMSWIEKGIEPTGQADSSLTWGPPQASAAPGDIWTATLTAAATCSSGLRGEQFADGVFAVAKYWARGIGDPDPEDTETQWRVNTYCGHEAQSTQLSWTFPAHGLDGEIVITVKASGVSGVWGVMDDWEYTYTWQS